MVTSAKHYNSMRLENGSNFKTNASPPFFWVAPPEKEVMMCKYESPYIHSSAVTLVLYVYDCALTLPTVARDMAEII